MTILVIKASTNIVTKVRRVKHALRAVAGGALVLGLLSPAAAEDPTALLLGMEAAYARVERYTARFVRQEVVEGVLRPREEALLKWESQGSCTSGGSRARRPGARSSSSPGAMTTACWCASPGSSRASRRS